jgi:hypothetical protein
VRRKWVAEDDDYPGVVRRVAATSVRHCDYRPSDAMIGVWEDPHLAYLLRVI